MEFVFITIGVFGIIASSVYVLLTPKTNVQHDIIQRRLDSFTAEREESSEGVRLLRVEEETFWERVAKFFLGEDELAAKYTAVRRFVHQAGYPGERAVQIFWGVRFFLAGVFGVGALFFGVLSGAPVLKILFLVAAGVGLGNFLPMFFVRRKAKRRRREIQETLPDTLDLLVVCVEAGLGLDSALVRVAKEQESQGLAIGSEFGLMTQEIRAGVSRRAAMSRFADRLELDELRSMVTFLTQTEEMGGSIARSLRIFAATMRQKRSQRAEEAARKLVIKLIFPMVLFILPAIFMVVLAPVSVNIVQVLGSGDLFG
jgi:tight adherence protein C